MARYIDADALMAKLKEAQEPEYLLVRNFLPNRGVAMGITIAMGRVNNAETVDAVPVVHSEWIPVDDGGDPGDTKCKRCGCYHHVWEAFGYYCQHCGAKMDGGK